VDSSTAREQEALNKNLRRELQEKNQMIAKQQEEIEARIKEVEVSEDLL